MKKILYFSASYCQPCKTLGPIMESLQGLVNYEKIDVENDSNAAIIYSVRNIPTLILVDGNGDELNRVVGIQSKQQILNFYNG